MIMDLVWSQQHRLTKIYRCIPRKNKSGNADTHEHQRPQDRWLQSERVLGQIWISSSNGSTPHFEGVGKYFMILLVYMFLKEETIKLPRGACWKHATNKYSKKGLSNDSRRTRRLVLCRNDSALGRRTFWNSANVVWSVLWLVILPWKVSSLSWSARYAFEKRCLLK